MIFKQLLSNVWQILDLLFFLAAAITFNFGGFYLGRFWGYVTLTLTFIAAGLLVEQVEHKYKGGDA